MQLFGFALADGVLLALVIWDWRSIRRVHALAISLAVLLAYHASVVALYRVEFWQAFAYWFRGLPLS